MSQVGGLAAIGGDLDFGEAVGPAAGDDSHVVEAVRFEGSLQVGG